LLRSKAGEPLTGRETRNIQRVLVGPGVIGRIPGELDILGADSRILMVADRNTYLAAGERVVAANDFANQ